MSFESITVSQKMTHVRVPYISLLISNALLYFSVFRKFAAVTVDQSRTLKQKENIGLKWIKCKLTHFSPVFYFIEKLVINSNDWFLYEGNNRLNSVDGEMKCNAAFNFSRKDHVQISLQIFSEFKRIKYTVK